ncbi:hypothetical protein LguiA_000386 [Lonicera macranthoides]
MSVPGGSSSPLTDEHRLAQIFEQVNMDIEEEDAQSRSEWLKVLIVSYFVQLMNHGLTDNLLPLDSVDTDVANDLIRNRPYQSLQDVRTIKPISPHPPLELILYISSLLILLLT